MAGLTGQGKAGHQADADQKRGGFQHAALSESPRLFAACRANAGQELP